MPNIRFIIALFMLTLFSTAMADSYTQTVKGRITDHQTESGLVGANVIITGTDMGAATDQDGCFRIENVPVGRYTIKVMYMGYKPRVIPEVLVGSGKAVDLNIQLEEDIIQSQDIVVRPDITKDKPLNDMAAV
ncbi:MAG: TonB-dependent receptor, partial [Caldithrix sp.]|nr:TonB-dependent receptor [Caldithrix sp.]